MTNKLEYWVVTDLDGTLMDENYDITPALDTLKLLKQKSIPVIPCTSKTASEVRFFRSQYSLRDSFIVENGGALYLSSPKDKHEEEIILGKSYEELRLILKQISKELNCPLIPLNDLSFQDIKNLTGLDPKGIDRALKREWSVPFLNPPDSYKQELDKLCQIHNVNIFQGNRMSHLLSENTSKGKAIETLKDLKAKKDLCIIALGDSPNDLPLLEIGDIAIVIPGKDGPNKLLKAGIEKGQFILANAPHAEGWSNSIRSIIKDHNDKN